MQFELKEGQLVTLVDNSDSKKWRIRIDNSEQGMLGRAKSYSGLLKEVTVPAIIILIPPTEPAALDAALRYKNTTISMQHNVYLIEYTTF